MSLKQVIVIRKDLNMRKGKMVAQGSHASLMGYLNVTRKFKADTAMTWLEEGQTKICVSVDSEQELHDTFKAAQQAKLPVVIIKDAGHTEFKEPTFTAIAIGPADKDEIDKITGHLKLL